MGSMLISVTFVSFPQFPEEKGGDHTELATPALQ